MDINAFLKNIILLKDEYLIDEVRKNSYIQTVSKKEKIYCEGTPPRIFRWLWRVFSEPIR